MEQNKPVRIEILKEVRIPVRDSDDVILEVGDIIEVLPKLTEEETKDLEDEVTDENGKTIKKEEEEKKEEPKEKEDEKKEEPKEKEDEKEEEKKEEKRAILRKEFHERIKTRLAEKKAAEKKE